MILIETTGEERKGGTYAELEALLEDHLPRDGHEWTRALFQLCRRLRGRPELDGVQCLDLDWLIKRWHRRCPADSVPPLGEVLERFHFVYDLVRVPLHQSAQEFLARIKMEAEHMEAPEWIAQYTEKERALVRVCVVLQRMSGERPFYLPCRVAGELLDIPYRRAAMLLRTLVAHGLLEIVTAGGGHKATRYRFAGHG